MPFAILLELSQYALHLEPLADLLLQASHLEQLLLSGLASGDTLVRKRARQVAQDLLLLQRRACSPDCTAGLSAVEALLGMYDGVAMYELRLVRGAWAAHWPVFVNCCTELVAAREGGAAKDGVASGSGRWQLGVTAGRLRLGYAAVTVERALRHSNPAVQWFAAMVSAELVCNEEVLAAMAIEPMWVAGDLARLLMRVPGCSHAASRALQVQIVLLIPLNSACDVQPIRPVQSFWAHTCRL